MVDLHALDRARNAEALWHSSAELLLSEPWVFDPQVVVDRGIGSLASILKKFKVSQRHKPDSDAWWRIAVSIAHSVSPAVNRAIFEGQGDAVALGKALRERGADGTVSFPMLKGPKVGPMSIRMLAAPGAASVAALDRLGVSVDVHLRRATEYLGLTLTAGKPLSKVRKEIQAAWTSDVMKHGASVPEPLAGTCAGLDPALWFWGKWGCGYCQRTTLRAPVSSVCSSCQFDYVVSNSARFPEGRPLLIATTSRTAPALAIRRMRESRT